MTAFFSRFQNKLKQDYGGRYLAYLLEELLTEVPELLTDIFCDLSRDEATDPAFEIEYEFTKDPRRRADLAVFGRGRKLIGLIEIKDEDHKSQRNEEQLLAYLDFVRRNPGTRFTIISKHALSARLESHLKKYHQSDARVRQKPLLLGELYRAVSARNSPVGKMFCDYLRDKGVTYESIELSRQMPYLLLQLAAPDSAGGFGRIREKANVANVPQVFNTLLGNADVLGTWFYDRFGSGIFKKPFTPHFAFHPYYEPTKLKEKLEKHLREHKPRDNPYFYPDMAALAADLDIGARAKLDEETALWIGYRFTLDLNGTAEIETKMRAELYVPEFEDANNDLDQEHPMNSFPTETDAQEVILSLVHECLATAIQIHAIPRSKVKVFSELNNRIEAERV
jgi:hypothetical protein